ncbi:MAG: LicD family protein [Thermoplasmatota archaeon]
MLRQGLRWRLGGIRTHLVIAARNVRRPATALQVLARAARRPTVNGRWRLQRFGKEALREVVAAADAAGAPVFVVYGTLLGWIRDGRLIPHDDDLDLALLDDDWHNAKALADHLAASGWRVTWFGDDEVRFTHARHGCVPVDVFRFRGVGDHWEGRAYSDKGTTLHRYRFPRHAVTPLAEGQVHGVKVRTPNDPEAFLEAHYGPDWRTPQDDWDYRTDAASSQDG